MCDSRRPLDGADSRCPWCLGFDGAHARDCAKATPADAPSPFGGFHVPADCDRCEPDSYGLIEGSLCPCDCHAGLTPSRRGTTWTGRDGVQR